MTRQIITALIVAVSSTVAVSSIEAGCHGHICHTGITLNGFHARFGCTPREAFVLFQRQPELITRFPEMAQFLQAQFGAFTATTTTTPATPAVAATETVAASETVVATTETAVADPAPASPVEATPADPAPATEAVVTPADGGEIAAPVAADPVAAAPAQSELEPLLGLWINENDAADQPIAKINLNNDGNATVTVNTALGQTEVTKPFAIEGDTFKLDGSDLAKVVSADADKVVLDANGTNLTFVRP